MSTGHRVGWRTVKNEFASTSHLLPKTCALFYPSLVDFAEEFHRQGDLEAERGVPISPLCSRDGHNQAKSQCDFVNFVVRPCAVSVSLNDTNMRRAIFVLMYDRTVNLIASIMFGRVLLEAVLHRWSLTSCPRVETLLHHFVKYRIGLIDGKVCRDMLEQYQTRRSLRITSGVDSERFYFHLLKTRLRASTHILSRPPSTNALLPRLSSKTIGGVVPLPFAGRGANE